MEAGGKEKAKRSHIRGKTPAAFWREHAESNAKGKENNQRERLRGSGSSGHGDHRNALDLALNIDNAMGGGLGLFEQ